MQSFEEKPSLDWVALRLAPVNGDINLWLLAQDGTWPGEIPANAAPCCAFLFAIAASPVYDVTPCRVTIGIIQIEVLNQGGSERPVVKSMSSYPAEGFTSTEGVGSPADVTLEGVRP